MHMIICYVNRIVFYIYTYCILTCPLSVPFDEDDKDKSVWFLDHDYLENMATMFKKVNGKEAISRRQEITIMN